MVRSLPHIPSSQSQPACLDSWQPQPLNSAAVTLPAEMYSSPDIYRLEQKQIFGKYWYYVGHMSQLDGAGSYFTVDIAEQPLVIVLDRESQLRAFFNICTHRAGPVALGSGKCHRLTCLYHAWNFDLDGSLKTIPDMDTADGFDRQAHALRAVKVDTWGPFIFVNLDPNSQPLSVQLGELPELFKRYNFQQWARAHWIDYWTDTNWKLYVENNTESYHEPTVHPILRKYYKHVKAEARYHYYLQTTPIVIDEPDIQQWEQHNSDLYQPGLSEQEMSLVSTMSFFPNFAWIVAPNCAIIYLIDPQGPEKTRVRWDWLVPDTEAAKAPENLKGLIEFYDMIQKEDLLLLPEVQKRIRSQGYVQGRLSPTREMGTHLFQELIMKAITCA